MNVHRVALAVLGVACAVSVGAADRPPNLPPNPGRSTPPPGIEARAVAVGAPAPAISLASTSGGTWTLARARDAGPVVLVFYRGDW
jgi:hypothetical protein